MQEFENKQEKNEKIIDIKGTLEDFIEEEKPELSQEEAIKAYKEGDIIDGLKLRKVPKDEIKKKVMSMYTDPDHIKITDPGKIEGNTVFTYLDAFCQPEHFERYLPDYANLDELKAHYQRGGLGDVKVKKFLNNVLQETLEPIRNRRKELEKDIPAIYEMLKKGSEEAEKVAAQTLADVKAAMKINYFDDLDLIRSQAERYGK